MAGREVIRLGDQTLQFDTVLLDIMGKDWESMPAGKYLAYDKATLYPGFCAGGVDTVLTNGLPTSNIGTPYSDVVQERTKIWKTVTEHEEPNPAHDTWLKQKQAAEEAKKNQTQAAKVPQNNTLRGNRSTPSGNRMNTITPSPTPSRGGYTAYGRRGTQQYNVNRFGSGPFSPFTAPEPPLTVIVKEVQDETEQYIENVFDSVDQYDGSKNVLVGGLPMTGTGNRIRVLLDSGNEEGGSEKRNAYSPNAEGSKNVFCG